MKGHAVTLQILFLRGISSWWKVEKTFSSLISWKHGAANGFCGAIHTSYQIRGAEFPVIRGLEKPKLLHTGTSTQHATLKSTLLSQFRYCELCDNDKQSNYSLMNVLFCTRALFPDFRMSSSTKRQKRETLRFSHRFFAYMHLSKREIFHSYKKSRKFFTFFTFLDQSSCIKS